MKHREFDQIGEFSKWPYWSVSDTAYAPITSGKRSAYAPLTMPHTITFLASHREAQQANPIYPHLEKISPRSERLVGFDQRRAA